MLIKSPLGNLCQHLVDGVFTSRMPRQDNYSARGDTSSYTASVKWPWCSSQTCMQWRKGVLDTAQGSTERLEFLFSYFWVFNSKSTPPRRFLNCDSEKKGTSVNTMSSDFLNVERNIFDPVWQLWKTITMSWANFEKWNCAETKTSNQLWWRIWPIFFRTLGERLSQTFPLQFSRPPGEKSPK